MEPRPHQRDGFTLTFWTFCGPARARVVAPGEQAQALERLHAGMRRVDVAAPHFTDRVAEAQRLVADRTHTPDLADEDRELLSSTLRTLPQAIGERSPAEQLLHGEPHPGNILDTPDGLLFIDLETCCRGPVELDLAHVPEEVIARYPGADHDLVGRCRHLVLAMVAAWRSDASDQFPNGKAAGRAILRILRDGPPWPALGDLRDAES